MDRVASIRVSLALLVLGTSCVTHQNQISNPNDLFIAAAYGRGSFDEAIRARIIRYRFVVIQFPLLNKGLSKLSPNASGKDDDVVVLNLFDDVVLRAVLDRREVRSNHSFTWLGHIEGINDSAVTLVVEDDVMAGNVRVQRSFYQVRAAGEGVYAIYQIDPTLFPPDSSPAKRRTDDR